MALGCKRLRDEHEEKGILINFNFALEMILSNGGKVGIVPSFNIHMLV